MFKSKSLNITGKKNQYKVWEDYFAKLEDYHLWFMLRCYVQFMSLLMPPD